MRPSFPLLHRHLALPALFVLAASVLLSCHGDHPVDGSSVERLQVEARATVVADLLPDRVRTTVDVLVMNPTGREARLLEAEAVVRSAADGREVWRFAYVNPCAGPADDCPLLVVPAGGRATGAWVQEQAQGSRPPCGTGLRVLLTLRGRWSDGAPLSPPPPALPSSELRCSGT